MMNVEGEASGIARILGLAGSLRRDSWNRRLLQSTEAAGSARQLVLYEDLASIPFFNEDEEETLAPAVARLRQAVAGADGLLIATPEYNHSYPAVLKNAIDWLSRGSKSALDGKPVALVGATPGSWGTRLAQAALRQVLTATGALVMPAPMLFVARVNECFDAAGNLIDPALRKSLNRVLSSFHEWIELHRRASMALRPPAPADEPLHGIVIDALREQDVGELLTVQRAAFLRDAQIYNDPFLPSLTQTQEAIRDELSDPKRLILAAKRNGRLVGSVRANLGERTAHIGRLMTVPDLEGRGIGGALLKAIESRLKGTVDIFELSTGKKSVANIEMYRRLGYVVCAESTDAGGIAIVRMQKRAPAPTVPAPTARP